MDSRDELRGHTKLLRDLLPFPESRPLQAGIWPRRTGGNVEMPLCDLLYTLSSSEFVREKIGFYCFQFFLASGSS